ncbi:MmcQ/YjbR family DNA-binding protein [Arundinibacter roseus]|uniref:MmcQ/YjbR family DNA-binding protein n=1 Tax=Arundinibacter roseus TaxID=2070510 RepID=A0A4R4KG88_9BACT|nr:MmcQ/YjbR family DNA-binding protein [Arundinibacter roseus]TDB66998.1 MmcQ/YjbR family DNA-binding protein [Arundinibacter roseus]
MNLEQLRDYCLSLPGTSEDFPFGEETLVFRVKGKIFLLTPVDSEQRRFNVKCDPEKAIELREEYPSVKPGYHMSKKHWNTILDEGKVPDSLLKTWIKDSYDLIVESLPAKARAELR